MNLAEWLYRSARTRPAAPALLSGERVEADYGELARRAAAADLKPGPPGKIWLSAS